MSSHLIASPSERADRIAAKRYVLLRFLRHNYYTTADTVGLLMNINSRQGIHTTLLAMERDGLLRRDTVETNGKHWTLWGITPHGQAAAFDPKAGEQPESRYFEIGRVGLSVLAHTLDLQRLGIHAERAGWSDWQLGDSLDKWQRGQSRPDAIVKSPCGIVYALECERTIKTIKRYQIILADRLQAIKRGEFARCIWLCQTQDLTERLQAIITSIKDVPLTGTRVQIEERHLAVLSFATYQDFPNNIGV
jgi:hypothetical protein